MEKKILSENVKQWFSLDEQISILSKQLRELRGKKKDLSKGLLSKMQEYDIKTFETKNGNLVYTERTVKTPVTKKHIISCLEKLITNDEDRNKIIEYIYENRETKTVNNIKKK